MVNYEARLTATFRALSDPVRRRIVLRLTRGSAGITELAALASMSLPGFLKHVRVLQAAGLVVTDKPGRTRHCTLAPEALTAAEEWLGVHRRFWEERLDALERLVGGTTEQEEITCPTPRSSRREAAARSTSTARSRSPRSASSPPGPTRRSSAAGSRRRKSTR